MDPDTMILSWLTGNLSSFGWWVISKKDGFQSDERTYMWIPRGIFKG